MIIKRYIANNMNEALTRIRYELGKEAVIISQRKIRKPGFAGLFAKKSIEVTAAVENMIKNEDNSVKESIEAIKQVMKNEIKAEKEVNIIKETQASALLVNGNKEESSDLAKEIREIREMMSNMVSVKTTERTIRKSKLQVKLAQADINDSVSKKIQTRIKSIEEKLEEDEKLKITLEKMISISKVKMEGKVILVGPTGVGKTTTIAKLAGRLALIEKKKVGLVTIDTYRIGAIEQLKTYAEIMELPFKVVITLKEMDAALDSMKDCDVILIDTTGRSSKNTMQLSELRAFVEKVNTKNIHLVISSTTKNNDIQAIIDGYKVLNYSNLIITKLDETSTYGSILNILDYAKKPLSFVTTGQSVPDDIKNLTAEAISNLILGVDSIC
ncbi:MAG: flagellar biosynthesis protein FlhF [Clostridiaceae bacterium]|nr:flagellar biosynthesis protein FlhF [Clostridiaceae bacterium]